MELFHGKVCPVCEIGKLEVCQEDVAFEYKGVKTVISGRTVFTCQECKESFFDPKEQREIEKLLTDERRKIDGLLTSQEIKRIRQQFKMTQVEFARILRVGEKTFARYESGQASQGYAMDNLLRILHDFPETIKALDPSCPSPRIERRPDEAVSLSYFGVENQYSSIGETTEGIAIGSFGDIHPNDRTIWADAAQAV